MGRGEEIGKKRRQREERGGRKGDKGRGGETEGGRGDMGGMGKRERNGDRPKYDNNITESTYILTGWQAYRGDQIHRKNSRT